MINKTILDCFGLVLRWQDLRLYVHTMQSPALTTPRLKEFSNRCLLFRRWSCGKAASCWVRILCGVLQKEIKECMDRCTGRRDETEIMLKRPLPTIIVENKKRKCW